jgi:hypothetical protein
VKVFSLLILILSFRDLQAAVQPITNGEGMWNVLTRIGKTVDGLLGALTPCTAVISQTNIGSGNTFIITSTGYYCLSESVAFTTGVAITISSNDVTLDLNGYAINGGGNSGTTAIQLSNGVTNVIIQNGIIENLAGTLPDGAGIRDATGNTIPLKNIVIRDLNFNTTSGMVDMNGGFLTELFDVDGALVENCNGFNAGGIVMIANSGIVRGCIVSESRGAVSNAILFDHPVAADPVFNNLVIEDCVMINNGGGSGIIEIAGAFNGVIRNCISQKAAFTAFAMADSVNMIFSDCIADSGAFPPTSFAMGFVATSIRPNANLLIERCVACNNGDAGFAITAGPGNANFFTCAKCIDCVAEFNQRYGFHVTQDNTTNIMTNLVFKGCSAQGNGVSGFLLEVAAVSNNITQVVFEDCVSQNNGGDGFTLLNRTATSIISNVVFRNCIAQANVGGAVDPVIATTFLGDGFSLGTPATNVGLIKDVMFEKCLSVGNFRDGFDFVATTSAQTVECRTLLNNRFGFFNAGAAPSNAYLSNVAMFNVAGDYSGVTDATAAVGGLAAVPNAWFNIST